jgi:predicted RNA methylase
MFLNAQNNYDFYQTPQHHTQAIYDDYTFTRPLKVLDVCCGLGCLSEPWYNNGHEITLVELNIEFIPLLRSKFPNATIIHGDFFELQFHNEYDVYLCNPPFNTSKTHHIYKFFFCKILQMMNDDSVFYFICPKMFYKDQMLINIEMPVQTGFALSDFIKYNNCMPPYYYYEKYNLIELNSDGFRFEKTKIKRMIEQNVVYDGFIDNDNFIVPYFEFRFLRNIFDFQKTNCRCALFKVNK